MHAGDGASIPPSARRRSIPLPGIAHTVFPSGKHGQGKSQYFSGDFAAERDRANWSNVFFQLKHNSD